MKSLTLLVATALVGCQANEATSAGTCEFQKDLAYFTMIGTDETEFVKAGVDENFTYFNLTVGPANVAPVVAVRVQEGDVDQYTTIRTSEYFHKWRHGYVEEGMDFNPDSFVVPTDKLLRLGSTTAAITVRFSDPLGGTLIFLGQFVALDKPKPETPGLYTLILRVYTEDEKTAAQLLQSHGIHPCYDPKEPHFHMHPSPKGNSVLGSSGTRVIETKNFVVEVYAPSIAAVAAWGLGEVAVDGIVAAGGWVAESFALSGTIAALSEGFSMGTYAAGLAAADAAVSDVAVNTAVEVVGEETFAAGEMLPREYSACGKIFNTMEEGMGGRLEKLWKVMYGRSPNKEMAWGDLASRERFFANLKKLGNPENDFKALYKYELTKKDKVYIQRVGFYARKLFKEKKWWRREDDIGWNSVPDYEPIERAFEAL